jgi:hypothetical protein
MDDRFDMILFSTAVSQSGGVTIIPGTMNAYGNDGNHFNDSINRPPNLAVGQIVADALHYASDHIPILALFEFESPIGIEPVSSEIPSEFNLSQNYPNPFNPSTVIKFDISQQSLVQLKVYDVLGRETAVLISQHMLPGEYEKVFDGSMLPGGVYFYRFTAGSYTETKKMILIK